MLLLYPGVSERGLGEVYREEEELAFARSTGEFVRSERKGEWKALMEVGRLMCGLELWIIFFCEIRSKIMT